MGKSKRRTILEAKSRATNGTKESARIAGSEERIANLNRVPRIKDRRTQDQREEHLVQHDKKLGGWHGNESRERLTKDTVTSHSIASLIPRAVSVASCHCGILSGDAHA